MINGKSNRGAALVEYGMLAGLISVVSIAAVLTMGGSVREAFAGAGRGLASANEQRAGYDITASDATAPETTSPEAVSPELTTSGYATWTMVAGEFRSNGDMSGYRSDEISSGHGSRISWGGTAEVIAFHHNDDLTSSKDPLYLIFRGSHLSGITAGMVIRCDDGFETAVADANEIKEATSIGGITYLTWDPSPKHFTDGQQYSCSLGEPAS